MGHTAWRTRRLESDARARVQSDQTTRTRRVQSERVSRPGDDREVRKRRSRTSSEDVESAGEDAREEIRDIKANSSLWGTYLRKTVTSVERHTLLGRLELGTGTILVGLLMTFPRSY